MAGRMSDADTTASRNRNGNSTGTSSGDPTTSSVDHGTVESATRLVAAGAVLVFLLYLVTLLPGVDRLVPATPVSVAALASAVVAVALAGLLAYAAPMLAALARSAVDRGALVDAADAPDRLRGRIAENVAGVVHWLAMLAAVIVLHRGFVGVAGPLLDDAVWMYDAAFLLVALVPVVFVTVRLTATVDPLSTLVADRVVDGSDGTTGEPGKSSEVETASTDSAE